MINSARGPALILMLCGTLIAMSWAMSRDTHKEDVQVWNASLANIELATKDVSHELLKLRGNLDNNYDSLTETFQMLTLHAKNIAELEQKQEAESSRIRPSIASNTDTLTTLIADLNIIIEDFKTELSIHKNSKSVAFQLLDEMRGIIGRNNTDWQFFLYHIENRLIQETIYVQQLSDQKLSDYIDEHLSQTESKIKKSYLTFLKLHVSNIEKYNPDLERLLKSYLTLETLTIFEINEIGKNIAYNYKNEIAKTRPALICMGLLLAFILCFGGYFIFKSIRYAKQIKHHTANLENLVSEKTKTLAQAMESLSQEVSDKQVYLENLKTKEAQLAKREAFFRAITETAPDPIILFDKDMRIVFVNRAANELFDTGPIGLTGKFFDSLLPNISSLDELLNLEHNEIEGRCANNEKLDLRIAINKIQLEGGSDRFVCILHDLTSQKSLERDLSQAQKLESVGQLAAGIAHEINTPAQFISDNLIFLQESLEELFDFIKECRDIAEDDTDDAASKSLQVAIESADLDYLCEEVPSAINQSSDGIKRIATIVRAMKDYSHPGTSLELSDINSALESTLTVSRGEWKYCAEVETNWDADLPLVPCVVSDVNQVALNMIVNAAHAIEDKFSGQDDGQGKICISTSSDENYAIIKISDNGNGMPESVKEKIFDPFFTTKSVGKGTGQGLSIAYKLIVDKHAGQVDVQSKAGEGTTFTIKIPLKNQTKTTDENASIESAA